MNHSINTCVFWCSWMTLFDTQRVMIYKLRTPGNMESVLLVFCTSASLLLGRVDRVLLYALWFLGSPVVVPYIIFGKDAGF